VLRTPTAATPRVGRLGRASTDAHGRHLECYVVPHALGSSMRVTRNSADVIVSRTHFGHQQLLKVEITSLPNGC
jgi:hypothetical protein